MGNVIHTVNVTYGSYYEKGIEITCNENDDIETVKAKVRKQLSLNFLPMANYYVIITNTRQLFVSEY